MQYVRKLSTYFSCWQSIRGTLILPTEKAIYILSKQLDPQLSGLRLQSGYFLTLLLNCNKANELGLTIDHLGVIHLYKYMVESDIVTDDHYGQYVI